MYLFTSERIGFRNWIEDDLSKMAAINADPDVMHYFPSLQNEGQTEAFIERMKAQLEQKGFTYFAAELLDTGEFIGFIGLSVPTFTADFTPCTDMGWRLDKKYWNKGFATEGAQRCLDYAFTVLQLDEVVAICPEINTPSENVMKKIGMTLMYTFSHPLLQDNERLQSCVLYKITNPHC